MFVGVCRSSTGGREIRRHDAIQQILDQVPDRTNLLAERQRPGPAEKQSVLDISRKRRRKVVIDAELPEALDAIAEIEKTRQRLEARRPGRVPVKRRP